MPEDDRGGWGASQKGIKRRHWGNLTTAQVETLAIQEESRPKVKKKSGQEIVGKERVLSERREGHTCVATHTTRDALFLFLSVGFCIEVECYVGMFTFGYDCIYGDIEDGLFLFFTLPFCAAVAVMERGDAVCCAVGGGLVGVVWRIVEFFLLCAFSGRGGRRGAVGREEAGGRL